jgi:ribosomal protein L40E
MIICNKCGAHNEDDAMRCARCRHKLQSGRRETEKRPRTEKLSLEVDEGVRSRLLGLLRPYFEAWCYALILVAATVVLLNYRIYWPLYALVPLLFVLLRWRKL